MDYEQYQLSMSYVRTYMVMYRLTKQRHFLENAKTLATYLKTVKVVPDELASFIESPITL